MRTVTLLALLLAAAGLSTPVVPKGAAPRPARNGRVQAKWSNGQPKSDISYRDDVYEGEYRTYYQSGRPYELRHFKAGHEDGVQQSWTESGELYLNYETRGGRHYGLVNAAPCVEADRAKDAQSVSSGPATGRHAPAGAQASSGGAALPYYESADFTPRWSPVDHRLAAFQLETQTGRSISEKDLAGRIHVASFVYTQCAAVCPILVSQLRRVQEAARALPDVTLVSYSVTPETDTPAVLTLFGKDRGIDPAAWWLVTGDRGQIYRLARTSYFADDNRAGPSAGGSSTDFLHSEKVLLVDGTGRLRGVYNGTQPHDIDLLIDDVQTLSAADRSATR